MKINKILIFLAFIAHCSLFAQQNFNYYREVIPATEGWNAIELNDSIVSTLYGNIHGLRLFQTTPADTLETPYLLQFGNEKWVENMVYSEILNKGYTSNSFQYLIDQKENNVTNYLNIFLRNKDFDYKVKLEGSNDLKNWLTIGEDFRIVDIKIDQNEFRSNSLYFTPCNFRYFKVSIQGAEEIDLYKTTLKIKEKKEGKHQILTLTPNSQYNKENKTSTHYIEFNMPTALSAIEPKINYTSDYLRNVKLYFLKDSVKTKNGNKANWEFVTSFQLSSLNLNYISFSPLITKSVKLVVEELDNPPLKIESVLIKKPSVVLISQLNTKNNYTLFYDNPTIHKPNYDIANFSSYIPDSLQFANLKNENIVIISHKDSLITNELWLWIILVIVILIMGYFTLKMIKKV